MKLEKVIAKQTDYTCTLVIPSKLKNSTKKNKQKFKVLYSIKGINPKMVNDLKVKYRLFYKSFLILAAHSE